MNPLRFALIGAGHIAQSAVLPAFANAGRNVALAGVISDDPAKRKALAKKYRLEATWDEGELDQALSSGAFDALYVATPNHLHLPQALAALEKGIHVLLEKPMTATMEEAERLRAAAAQGRARLMVAYRLHCDPFYVGALDQIRRGAIGEARLMNASFTMQVTPGNVRVQPVPGAGPVPDLGVYCINAARTVFAAEPEEVLAVAVRGRDERSAAVPEMVAAILRFPGDRLASFTTSFGARSTSWYQVIGSTGQLCLDEAFTTSGTMTLDLTKGARTTTKSHEIGDQFAAEIAYFATCVQAGRDPEPGAEEGYRDMRVIDAIDRAAKEGRPVKLPPLPAKSGPTPEMTGDREKPDEPELINVQEPNQKPD